MSSLEARTLLLLLWPAQSSTPEEGEVGLLPGCQGMICFFLKTTTREAARINVALVVDSDGSANKRLATEWTSAAILTKE